MISLLKFLQCSLMSRLWGFLFISIYCSFVYAASDVDIKTNDNFQTWVNAKILCQSTTNEVPIYDKKFIDQLHKLGFIMELDIDEETNSYDGVITIPNSSIRISEFVVNKVTFSRDSGTEFSAYISTKPSYLVDLLKIKGLIKYPLLMEDDDALFTFLTTKPSKNLPYGIENKGIVIKATDTDGIFSIGCRVFDY